MHARAHTHRDPTGRLGGPVRGAGGRLPIQRKPVCWNSRRRGRRLFQRSGVVDEPANRGPPRAVRRHSRAWLSRRSMPSWSVISMTSSRKAAARWWSPGASRSSSIRACQYRVRARSSGNPAERSHRCRSTRRDQTGTPRRWALSLTLTMGEAPSTRRFGAVRARCALECGDARTEVDRRRYRIEPVPSASGCRPSGRTTRSQRREP
jgi:hypothetical protein